ncbi:UDP-GlcNAc:betaGal beta-1,3-N-acetylglucosaminyltransferase 7 [Striga asiatica]|uniref:UDP-GlcNAc:betaGal beta-1,3-N-acetylglucosaminyltransferase 7 n=1 Tax=Striga asiatica TaxID=4170 RepID=A0A5A7QG85_STRAF|nr:UDP-GlcNAc:betaGal beta-1,3-N-acetylglucosaminyltransferase 7 [Striga asiatica]
MHWTDLRPPPMVNGRTLPPRSMPFRIQSQPRHTYSEKKAAPPLIVDSQIRVVDALIYQFISRVVASLDFLNLWREGFEDRSAVVFRTVFITQLCELTHSEGRTHWDLITWCDLVSSDLLSNFVKMRVHSIHFGAKNQATWLLGHVERKKIIVYTGYYLSLMRDRGFLDDFELFFCFIVFPNFSVTTHSFTRLASRSPMIAAFDLCRDMTFSNSIQMTSRCIDLWTNWIFLPYN